MTELAYKDVKLQNDRTYRVYLYPDNSPCAVDIDQRNRRGESVSGWRGPWRGLWHHRNQYRPRPCTEVLTGCPSGLRCIRQSKLDSGAHSPFARLCRLARCNKSSAISGTPDVLPT
jgi:hypothetical protein